MGQRYDPKDPDHPEPVDLHDASTCTLQELAQQALEHGLDRVQHMIRSARRRPYRAA